MPTSAPEMPVTLTDPVAFFCAVSTVAMVSPPIRAATCAALAAADDSNSAAEAAKIERKFIVKLPVFLDPLGINTAGTGGAAKRMQQPENNFRQMHPNAASQGRTTMQRHRHDRKWHHHRKPAGSRPARSGARGAACRGAGALRGRRPRRVARDLR